MKSNIRFLVTLASTVLLVSCEPMYKTTYQFVPPQSPSVAMGVSQCQQAKQVCEQSMLERQQMCRDTAMNQAAIDYQDYVQKHPNDAAKKSVKDFYTDFGCDASFSGCNEDYRQCYIGSGGKVLETTKCVAFCDKVKRQ